MCQGSMAKGLFIALNSKDFPIWNVKLGKPDPTEVQNVWLKEFVPENINGKKVRSAFLKQCHNMSAVTEGTSETHLPVLMSRLWNSNVLLGLLNSNWLSTQSRFLPLKQQQKKI